jgi:hypothetical protein
MLVAAIATAVAYAHGLQSDESRVETAHGGIATARAARAAAAWHPADWLPHATAGVRLSSEGRCGDAMPWLIRAMSLDPSAAAPHLGAARCLAGRDDIAARREYRLAVMFGIAALPEAAVRYPALDDLFEVAPDTPDGLLSLGSVLWATRPADAAVAYRRALDDFGEERALLPLARVHARLGEHEDVIRLARRHSARYRTDAGGYELAASSLLRLGRDDEAQAELECGLAAIPGSPILLAVLVERSLAAHRWSEARRLADEIAPRTPEEVAGKHLLIARAFAAQGRLGEAIERARSAAAAQPDRPGSLITLAAYCEQAARYDDALGAVRRAAALPTAAPGAYAARIAALEAARTAQVERDAERRALEGEKASPRP